MKNYEITCLTNKDYNNAMKGNGWFIDAYTINVEANTEYEARKKARATIKKTHHIYTIKEK